MTFRYPLPESSPESRWSGFSDEARTSLSRIAMTPSAANQLLTPYGSDSAEGLNAEVAEWANPEVEDAIKSWIIYDRAFAGNFDTSELRDFDLSDPNRAKTLERLYEAKQALNESGELTPDGKPIGETMKVVLLPWQNFSDNFRDIPVMLEDLRNAQGVGGDYINNEITKAIYGDKPFYRSWDTPAILYTARQYLDYKLEKDGAWGIALMQASDDAGIKSIVGKSPDDITSMGSNNPRIGDAYVGSMGIFEWWALTLQEDPRKLSTQDYSWMLANRIDVDGGPHVPDGDWYDGQVGSGLRWADYQVDVVRPRLAVM